MEHKNIFSFDMEWNYKTISMFIVLLALPNLLGMLNISTAFGFKLHFFQMAIFFAALLYGPVGGMMSGVVGSVYSAFLMGNPYIVLFNALLGLMVGIFFKYGFNFVFAVILAMAVEFPVLYIVDHYVVGMPVKVIGMLFVALIVSNLVWASLVMFTKGYAKKFLE